MSRLVVDLGDPTPPYEQIRRGVIAQVQAGALRPGDRLPSIRVLARDLGLAAGTVARAYKELEEAGVLLTGRGAGTRVAEGAPRPPVLDEDLLRLAADAVEAARSDGHTDADILAAVRRALAAPGGSGG